ncbi:MAG: FAD-binding protein, partial [Burkholderiaceae bacterium]
RHLSGSKYPRSVYVKSGTGNAILGAISKSAIKLGVKEHLALRIMSLIKVDNRVCGALALDRRTGTLTAFLAGSTVMATGGIGRLYSESTYPADIFGDSYALALDAGATLVDMEFVQFEPTVVSTPEAVKGMEMPTAMLGDGAIMTNTQGERFMCRYNPPDCEKRIEKAKMALFIQKEIDEGRGTDNGSVYFDVTGLSPECLHGYVTHYRRLVNAGVDPSSTPIQIHPAAHSLMGGIKIDNRCYSGVPGLFACGEAAGGVHGASRIAGNGASDAIVFGRVAGKTAQQMLSALTPAYCSKAKEIAESHFQRAQKPMPVERATPYLQLIPEIMASKVGIRRSGASLKEAVDSLRVLLAEIQDTWDGSPFHPLAGARSAALVGLSIAGSALRREESRGAHFRTDFPTRDDERWKRSNLARLDSRHALTIL